ncbi:AAA domain-containing protein, putative AbiEii toxin, Type IV TA system [Flavobacterium fontis]|uniref:AAA domain-containing protein, putative AbiEii toxin, Type IV TA system n=1 Tax=Flavobacterium fontis TaxID=1124188 RepID=A0A1M5EZD3_9FLAO|nr:AAA family ATPase [Flavobacterium fontis]SHF84614.1 AAA domain-containing protein, putative AbiEii toxin, Type IV TA system [Flavobacterium fontis]
MRKDRYKIPKGYKGISNEIILEFNTQLAVITGLNGCGKSTMLKYLYENYPDRSKCFIKTPQNFNFQSNERRTVTSIRGSVRYKDDVSFDNVMQDIESVGLRLGRIDTTFLDKTDFYSSLFDQNSINYEKGYTYLESIAKLLSEYQFDDLDNIKRSFGVITENDVDQHLILDLNKSKDENQINFGVKQGKSILQKYKNFGLNEEQTKRLNLSRKKIEDKLKIELRKKSSVNSEQSLKKYVYGLLTREFRSIESIVDKMSNKIYQDFKTKSSRTKTIKLWQEINNELHKYYLKGYFKYKLVPPQIFESNYEIAFERFDKSTQSFIHFDSLSSGEKVIFELICYYFASKESKLEMIMLDEFDANLNPLLAEQYIEVIKEQFKDIKVVLTTHSPSTVVEVEPNELFELNDSKELKCAFDEDGKREILKRLAPKFVYHGEFGILEDVFNYKYEMIVFLEGKNDVKNFESGLTNEKYKFIDSHGVGNMPDLVKIFKAIPFFKKLAQQKLIVFLFDFDQEGIDNMIKCVPKNSQEIFEKFNKKECYLSKVEEDTNIYVTHLIPDNDHSWKLNNEYRHQELKKQGEQGIKRQFANLDLISLL